MGCFVCLLRPSGEPVTERDRARAGALIRRRGLCLQGWLIDGGFAATAVGTHLSSSPSIASVGSLSVVGTVHLDNREELASGSSRKSQASDLEIVGAVLRDRGRQSLVELIGDFAFVCWDSRTQMVLAARDSLGVRHLYWSLLGPDLLGLGSHPSLLAQGDAYSREYIAHWFAGARRGEDTIYDGVRLVPAGSSISLEDGRVVVDRYWSPENVPSGDKRSIPEHCDEFMGLFQKAVRCRLPENGRVWAELSGGLDTSSVVMTSELLHRSGAAPTRIAGTLTYSDSLSSSADESEYVSAVLAASGLPNQEMRDHWLWQDDGSLPPETEYPGIHTIAWALERHRDTALKEAGADVLLTGSGGDTVLGVNPFYFADWVARGRFLTAWRELIRSCVIGHHSLWKFAFENAIAPLLPAAVRSRYVTGNDWVVPSWVNADFRRRYDVNGLARSRRIVGGLRGSGGGTYHEVLVNRLRSLASASRLSDPGVDYERRHPFLSRSLAEFALRLPPPDAVDRPLPQKWVLREAMRGILPEVVRTRVSKGSQGARMLWSLQRERHLVEWMLRDPIVAQMGWVDSARLREAYSDVRVGRAGPQVVNPLLKTLALETWLRIRSGQWPLRSGQEVRVHQPV
jgi:asparagine synthase (glutamine-hydrolysing)